MEENKKEKDVLAVIDETIIGLCKCCTGLIAEGEMVSDSAVSALTELIKARAEHIIAESKCQKIKELKRVTC